MGGVWIFGKVLQRIGIPEVPGQGPRMVHDYGMVPELSAGADGSYRSGRHVDAEYHRRAGSALADL